MEIEKEEKSQVIDERRKKLVNFFNKLEIYEKLLLLLAVASIIYRLYYFFHLGNQPIWWDEGDYLALSKVWALNDAKPEWWAHFSGMRPLLLPLLWAGMFKFGLGETAVRFFTELIPSLGAIFLCYLIGKDMFDKRVGLIAATMMSGYWVFTFYTYRLLTDVPAVFFGLLSIYFFWNYYQTDKIKSLYLASLFGVLAFSVRFPYALVPITSAIFLLIIRRQKVFFDKKIWKGLLATFIFLSPYLIYLIANKFAPLQFYGGGASQDPIGWYGLPLFISLFFSAWLISFVLGCIAVLYPLVFYPDLVIKQKTKEFNKELYLTLWIVVNLCFFVFGIRQATDRWMLVMMPACFIVAGRGLMFLHDILRKYSKQLALVVVLGLLALGLYQNINHANSLIEVKKDSYGEEKFAGEWIKANTPESSKVVTASVVQIYYYAERQTYGFNRAENPIPDYCWKTGLERGWMIENETCMALSEAAFEKFVVRENPDYYVIHVFEPAMTPKWAYDYPQRKNMTPVQAYMNKDNPNQPMLILYKFNKDGDKTLI